ncbi:hypothetical protein HMPREF9080_01116 [Cardiobacterium valvarum F0432]|uniref:Uncharacterized protein n=1 Tax=Cardiobacterium valvarum F0432 TaxID=797473 RepID=G9ZED1_9GAMM|nr:hypothetical protein HMPREF9080_01116 [Cardiobacterium valvarum F0432]
MNCRLQEPQRYCCLPLSRRLFFLIRFELQKGHFLCSKVLTPCEALQRKGHSDF